MTENTEIGGSGGSRTRGPAALSDARARSVTAVGDADQGGGVGDSLVPEEGVEPSPG